jgi:hypothetical protein
MNLSVRASGRALLRTPPSHWQHRRVARLMSRAREHRAERILAAAGLPRGAATGTPLLVAARLVSDPRDSRPEPLDDLADDAPPRSHQSDPTRPYWVAQAAVDHRASRPS